MSNDESVQELKLDLEKLEKEYSALKSALARSRNSRLIVLVGAFFVVGIVGLLFWSFAKEIMSDQYKEKLIALAEETLEKNKDDYLNEVQQLVNESAPILKNAFYARTKLDMPKYTAAIAEQREKFAESIRTQMRDDVNNQYREVVKKYSDKLAKEFPELESPELKEKAIAAIEKAFESIVEKCYIDSLAEGIEDIYSQWDGFPVSKIVDESAPAEDLLIGLLMELVGKKIAN